MAAPVRTSGRVGSVAVAVAVAAGGLILSLLVTVPAVLLLGLDTDALLQTDAVVVTFLTQYAGYLLAAVGYLVYTGRGLGYVDLRWPSWRDLKYVLGGIVGIFGVAFGLGLVATALDLPRAPSSISELAGQGNVEILLVLVPLVLLVNAPVEELLFRNVIQKRLYEGFSRRGAVVVASLIFALQHFLAYLDANLVATTVQLVVIFAGSLVFGLLYERTDNLTVPIVVHGVFNAIQLGILYLYLRAGGSLEAATVVAAFP